MIHMAQIWQAAKGHPSKRKNENWKERCECCSDRSTLERCPFNLMGGLNTKVRAAYRVAGCIGPALGLPRLGGAPHAELKAPLIYN